jgi:glutamine amidotransferase-like uncharacterized protein/predicted deacylase
MKQVLLHRPYWLLATFLLTSSNWAFSADQPTGILAKGTPFATPYYVQATDQPGPTIVITGGVHGNEPAGAYAAEQIRHWKITRGKVIVIPRSNVQALNINKRLTPDIAEELSNLNRNFPRTGMQEPPRGVLATSIWELVKKHDPQWLVDLHEGYDFNRINPKSVGSTIISSKTPAAHEATALMLAALNVTIEEENKKFRRRGPPIDSSLARAANEHLGIESLILETTFKQQRLPKRARQHRIMMHRLLTHLNMLDKSVTVETVTASHQPPKTFRIAIYDAPGTAGPGIPKLHEHFHRQTSVQLIRVSPADIANGILAQFQLVIFSGGSGSGQSKSLGEAGRKEVRDYIRNGGGYIGICAGSYLACEGFSWGLNVLDAKTVSNKWRRGRAIVKMELTPPGHNLLGKLEHPTDIKYANGPILAPANSDDIPDFQPLAFYRTEIAENDSPKGVMVNSPAVVSGSFGKGRVVCFGPHPEQTPGLEAMLWRSLLWAANRPLETPLPAPLKPASSPDEEKSSESR